MANPYLANNKLFGQSQPRGVSYPQGQQAPYGSPAQGGTAQYGTPTQHSDAQFQGVQDAYYGPDAGSRDTGRLTFDDVIMKTVAVVGTVILVAAASWILTPPELTSIVLIGGVVLGLVLGLVNAFKKEPSPGLIMAYAVAQGAFLGVLSRVFENQWDGVVVQAVLATFVTFGVTLALFRSGKVRVTPKFTRFMMIGLISYGLFALINLGIVWFTDIGGTFGLRTGGFGLVIGAIAVVLAAMTLIADFDQITRGVQNGVPAKFAWTAAFGIAVSLIWLYIEFLRIIAILRGD